MGNPYILVSYSHKDADRVQKVISQMQALGYCVWYDDGIEGSSEWAEAIATKIFECSYFISFISKSYLESDNCMDELSFAADFRKKRLLVYLESIDLPLGIQMRHGRIQAIHMYKYREENTFLNRLMAAKDIDICRLPEFKYNDSMPPEETVNLQTIHNRRSLLKALHGNETAIIPLCKYFAKLYKEKKNAYPWLLIPISLIINFTTIVILLASITYTTNFSTWMHSIMLEELESTFVLILGVLFCLLFTVFVTLKQFWLIYISPLNRHFSHPIFTHVCFCSIAMTASVASIPIYIFILLAGSHIKEILIELKNFQNPLPVS